MMRLSYERRRSSDTFEDWPLPQEGIVEVELPYILKIGPPYKCDAVNAKKILIAGQGVSPIRRCPAMTSMTPARIVSIATTPIAVIVSSASQIPSTTARAGFT